MGSWVPGAPPNGMVCTLGSGPQGLPQQPPPWEGSQGCKPPPLNGIGSRNASFHSSWGVLGVTLGVPGAS